MPATTHFRQLSAPRQTLVRLFQSINFGRIEDPEGRGGEPVFNPAPRVLIAVDLQCDEGPRPEHELGDFAIREEIVRLMDRLRELGDGAVEHIEVRAGLPRRMVVEANRLGVRR
jgi:hypothetical protein